MFSKGGKLQLFHHFLSVYDIQSLPDGVEVVVHIHAADGEHAVFILAPSYGATHEGGLPNTFPPASRKTLGMTPRAYLNKNWDACGFPKMAPRRTKARMFFRLWETV